jgi:acyl-CoA thioester hydrolase
MPKEQLHQDAIPPTHRTELRIPLFEVDLGHAVYHGNYFHFFELAREAFLRDLGYPYRRFMELQMHLTVVEASCLYRKSLHYDDLIEILTGIAWWRSRSLAFTQSIFRAAPLGDALLCTDATFNMVCVQFSGRPTVLPPDFVGRLEEWSRSHGASGAP